MRYLEINEVIEMYLRIMEQSGGSPGIRDRGALDSALTQPQMSFGGQELYPNLVEKAAALGFSLVLNHPFVDGNKRIGHAALEKFLILNGHEINASVDEQEQIFLQLAAGELSREDFTAWLENHIVKK